MKLVMATNNAGKLHEARAIAGDRLEILSLEDIGYRHDIEETADTLEGNALIKVRAIKDATGLDCFADDTGLMVDALGGAPGVYTARYAGEGCTPDDNIDLMLKNMEGVADRSACFRTCVALSLGDEEHLFKGEAHGSIATERSGSHGFGYDPIFISSETGKCFADMTEEDKNAISHRGRAISAMMKWLSALCIALFAFFSADAASSADWRLYNTFDDKIENIYDTPDKTYFLVQAQYQDAVAADNLDKYLFLFCLEKESGEIRPYNTQNFLSGQVISIANYNAQKRYLMLVYDDYTIDFLFDNGDVKTLQALKNYSTQGTKNVRSISFDPEKDRAYLATDFGFVTINDKKYEVANSCIYDTPIDYVARASDRMLIVREGKLYWDHADGRHISLSDFKESNWGLGSEVNKLMPVAFNKVLLSRNENGKDNHFILLFIEGETDPKIYGIGSFHGADIVENKDGLLLTREAQIVQLDRDSGKCDFYPRRDEDYAVPCGSWDLRDIYYAKPRSGFYSVRRNDDNSYVVTAETARPNAPATFRSTDMMYSPRHGMLVNTHGIDANFNAHSALNPILLSGLKDGEWEMHGLPYFDERTRLRLINPCGMVQDPDNPDVFYFGSLLNGLLRYNITDMSDLLHMTRSNDNPSYPGHVSVQEPYKGWGSAFMLLNPRFDSKGNLVLAHVNVEDKDNFKAEIWMWTPEQRRASTSPETFQPFIRLKVDGLKPNKANLALPLNGNSTKDMIVYFPFNMYQRTLAVYDHNGTPAETSDDRQASVEMTSLEDSDGKLSCKYYYCAVEDPSTGLVWVGTDNGVFTFDPARQFQEPGRVSRIKVSRNDGTSLADYLLAGTTVNDISIDSSGRKWFSISGGGVVCTSPDGKTILEEITSENSMLPSDQVYATCYNPSTNSIMAATSVGLCEYFLGSQGATAAASDVRAYPNPVRHDYYGWVTIDGLEENAIVKIADSAGNIVRELGPASSGRVQWDVCGMDLNRVPSGVYFVLASSGSTDGNFSEATKILVINR